MTRPFKLFSNGSTVKGKNSFLDDQFKRKQNGRDASTENHLFFSDGSNRYFKQIESVDQWLVLHKLEQLFRDNLSSPPFALVTYMTSLYKIRSEIQGKIIGP